MKKERPFSSLILLTDCDEPPPPPPDVAQNDLMMRLGLLLGDRLPQSSSTSQLTQASANQTDESAFASSSSLSGEGLTPDRQTGNSPPSVMTGQ